jgi:hypothetical protein
VWNATPSVAAIPEPVDLAGRDPRRPELEIRVDLEARVRGIAQPT